MSATWAVFGLLQLVGLLCVLQPWNDTWRDAGIALFAVEALLAALLFLPVFLYQWRRRGRSARKAARVTVDALMDLVTGLVP